MSNSRLLIVMRHGEADEQKPDTARCLTRTGIGQVHHVTHLLMDMGIVPDMAVCSGIVRARQTMHEICQIIPLAPDHIIDCGDELYKARSVDDVVSTLARRIFDECQCALVVGHNPGIGMTAAYFLSRQYPHAGSVIQQEYPTSTAAVIEVNCTSWAQLTPQHCYVREIVSGSDLPKSSIYLNPSRS